MEVKKSESRFRVVTEKRKYELEEPRICKI